MVDVVYSEELGKPSKAHGLPSGQSNNCELSYGRGLTIGIKWSGQNPTGPTTSFAPNVKERVTMLANACQKQSLLQLRQWNAQTLRRRSS